MAIGREIQKPKLILVAFFPHRYDLIRSPFFLVAGIDFLEIFLTNAFPTVLERESETTPLYYRRLFRLTWRRWRLPRWCRSFCLLTSVNGKKRSHPSGTSGFASSVTGAAASATVVPLDERWSNGLHLLRLRLHFSRKRFLASP